MDYSAARAKLKLFTDALRAAAELDAVLDTAEKAGREIASLQTEAAGLRGSVEQARRQAETAIASEGQRAAEAQSSTDAKERQLLERFKERQDQLKLAADRLAEELGSLRERHTQVQEAIRQSEAEHRARLRQFDDEVKAKRTEVTLAVEAIESEIPVVQQRLEAKRLEYRELLDHIAKIQGTAVRS